MFQNIEKHVDSCPYSETAINNAKASPTNILCDEIDGHFVGWIKAILWFSRQKRDPISM
jgi:hypothetical protein